jgi:hypothetical protein
MYIDANNDFTIIIYALLQTHYRLLVAELARKDAEDKVKKSKQAMEEANETRLVQERFDALEDRFATMALQLQELRVQIAHGSNSVIRSGSGATSHDR